MHLKEAIRLLRPDVNILPNRKLGSTLRESCHAELLAKVDKRLAGSKIVPNDRWLEKHQNGRFAFLQPVSGISVDWSAGTRLPVYRRRHRSRNLSP